MKNAAKAAMWILGYAGIILSIILSTDMIVREIGRILKHFGIHE